MYQSLLKPGAYPENVKAELRLLPNLATRIANQWLLGWPTRVKSLLASGAYLQTLKDRLKQAEEALEAPNLNHLAEHEKLEHMGIDAAPP